MRSTFILFGFSLVVVFASGCASTDDFDNHGFFGIYAEHFRASDPGLTGIWETCEAIGAGGWSDVGGFFEHMERGVDGWSTVYSWMGALFHKDEWTQLAEFFELWSI